MDMANKDGSSANCSHLERLESAICLEPLRTGQDVQPMVRCQHLFHAACVEALVEARQAEGAEATVPLPERVSCPLCRGPLLAGDLQEVQGPVRILQIAQQSAQVGIERTIRHPAALSLNQNSIFIKKRSTT